jgi:hypothetical protein
MRFFWVSWHTSYYSPNLIVSLFTFLSLFPAPKGDFEFNDYRDSPTVIILWALFTVFGVIIMLNVLIAGTRGFRYYR